MYLVETRHLRVAASLAIGLAFNFRAAAVEQAQTACKAAAEEIVLTAEQRESENQILLKFGLNLHGQVFLAERPFSGAQERPFVMPSQYYMLPFPEKVSARDLLADLSILKTALRMEYSGWESAEKRGWNWDRWFESWCKALSEKRDQVIDVAEAFAPVAELKKIQPDNHTAPMVPFEIKDRLFVSRSATALLARKPRGPVTQILNGNGEVFNVDPSDMAAQPRKVLFSGTSGDVSRMSTKYSISYPRNRGQAVAVIAGGEKIPLVADYDEAGSERLKSALSLGKLTKDMATYVRLAPEIGYLRMPSTTVEHAQEYADLADNIAQMSDGREKVLIVDLRGNTGGSLYINHFTRWYSQANLKTAMAKVRVRTTQKSSYLARSLSWGAIIADDALSTATPEVLEELQSVVDNLSQPRTPEPKPTFKVSEGPPGAGVWGGSFNIRQDPRKPILLVLMDNWTASNGEMVVGILSKLPNAVIAGVNTLGVGEFGAVGKVLLPHSKVLFQIATNRSEIFKDGRSFEGFGVGPHILLNTAQTNSPEFIVQLATSLRNLR